MASATVYTPADGAFLPRPLDRPDAVCHTQPFYASQAGPGAYSTFARRQALMSGSLAVEVTFILSRALGIGEQPSKASRCR